MLSLSFLFDFFNKNQKKATPKARLQRILEIERLERRGEELLCEVKKIEKEYTQDFKSFRVDIEKLIAENNLLVKTSQNLYKSLKRLESRK